MHIWMRWILNAFGKAKKPRPRKRVDLSPPNPDWFWSVVDQTIGGTRDEQFEAHTEVLRRMAPKQLIEFYSDYQRAHAAAGTWELWGAAYVLNGGCSDDGFTYFRDWLISRGSAVYRAALKDPETLAPVVAAIPDGEYPEFEFYGYVPSRVYSKDKNVGDFPIVDHSPIDITITGQPFDEDTVTSQYPKLAEVARG